MDKEKIDSHPSYGLIGISRITSSREETLFGSSIGHSNIIALQISRAEKHRNLNRDWYLPKEELIEIWLSPSQFADLITTPNVGSGVPCTIRHINRTPQGECPEVKVRKLFEQEFKQDVWDVTEDVRKQLRQIQTLFGENKPLKVSQRKEILGTLRQILQDLECNLPFVQTQFNEAMDKTVKEAKAEVEASISQKVQSLGIEGLRAQVAGVSIDSQLAPSSAPNLLTNGDDGGNLDDMDNH